MRKASGRAERGPVEGTTRRLARGTRFGDYVIDRPLDGTSVEETYVALHIGGQRVRLALFPPNAAALVLNHACMLHSVSHPGVPRVCDFGIADHRPWIAYEWVAGAAISDLIADRPLCLSEILALLRHASGLLAFAHLNGVTHRNLDLGSLLWCAGERFPVRIVGWELTRGVEDSGGDAAGDAYALGLAIHELLAASATPLDDDPAAYAARASLAAWVDQLLQLDPDQRPTCIETFEQVLRIEKELERASQQAVAVEDIELDDEPTSWSAPPEQAAGYVPSATARHVVNRAP
jgi:hypothetical protein